MGEDKNRRPILVPWITLMEVAGRRLQLFPGAGAPTDGTSGDGAGTAGPGSLYFDVTNGTIYINSNTLASPTWSQPAFGGLGNTVAVINETGVTIEAGDLVSLAGWDETEAVPNIVLADADAYGLPAEFVARADIFNGATGIVYTTFRETGGLDLAGAAEGDPIYLSTTPGDGTLVDPTDADPNAIAQIVGRVAIVATDVAEYDTRPLIDQIGTDQIQDAAIELAKMAIESVDSDQYVDGSIDTAHIGANQVTGAKLPESAIGALETAAVNITHDSGATEEILAADVSNARLVWVRGTATIAGSGDPDLDVGSDSTDPNGIVDDWKAGAWAVGDRFTGFLVLPKDEALIATWTAGSTGAIDVRVLVVTPLVQTAQIADGAVTAAKQANPAMYDAGAPSRSTLRMDADVVDAQTVTIGSDVYEFEDVTNDSTDDTQGNDFNNTTTPLTLPTFTTDYANVTPVAVGDIIRIASELMVVSVADGTSRTFVRGVSGTSVATHANAVNVLDGGGTTGSNIAVGLTGTLTPTAAMPALVADINDTLRGSGIGATELVLATQISVNELLLQSAATVGGTVAASAGTIATTETLGGANNEWDTANMRSGKAAGVRKMCVIEHTVDAVEVALGAVRMTAPFTVAGFIAQVFDSSGELQEGLTDQIAATGNRVEWDGNGATNPAAGDVVHIIAWD